MSALQTAYICYAKYMNENAKKQLTFDVAMQYLGL